MTRDDALISALRAALRASEANAESFLAALAALVRRSPMKELPLTKEELAAGGNYLVWNEMDDDSIQLALTKPGTIRS